MSTAVFTLALVVAAPGPSGLQRGDELTYSGSVVEAAEQRLRREHEITVRAIVLERQEGWADVAVLTMLRRAEDAIGRESRPITGIGPGTNAPPLVRLDLVRVHADGTVYRLLPAGPRLKLDDATRTEALWPIPLDSFPASEMGIFPPRVPHSTGPGEPWKIASAGNRPDEAWVAKKLEFVNAEQCQVLVMNQQSADWLEPIGGQRAWHRADAVWVSTEDGTARKLHRVIQQREGRAAAPVAWVEVKYELKTHEKLSGKTYDRVRRDVEVAYLALTDATALARDAASNRLGPRAIDDRKARLDAYLAESEPGTPYREAILAANRTLDAASRSHVTAGLLAPASSPAGGRSRWPEPGQTAPEILAGRTLLSQLRGKPVVLVFCKPGSETTDLALAIADAVNRRYGGGVTVLPFAVFGDSAQLLKDRDRLRLKLPIYSGTAASEAFGVESVPRFALLDPKGKVVWTFTGVGPEVGGLLKDQVDRLAGPVRPAGPVDTTPSTAPTGGALSPRP